MRNRIRLFLPLAQVVVPVALAAGNVLWPGILARPSWTLLVNQFFLGLGAPAAQIKVYLIRLAWMWDVQYIPTVYIIDTLVYFVLLWLLWYAVSIEIGGNGRSVLTPKTGMRRVADVLAVVFGGVLINSGIRFYRGEYIYVTPYPDLVAVLFLIWGATVAVFYGRDLWTCFGAAQKDPIGKDHPC